MKLTNPIPSFRNSGWSISATLSARPEAVVAWTGKRPTGFCPKLSIWDILLPRGPRDLLFTFYGPGIVWIEGSNHNYQTTKRFNYQTSRRLYGV